MAWLVAAIIGICGMLVSSIWNGVSTSETKRHNKATEEQAKAEMEQEAQLQREQEIADYQSQLALQQQQQEYDEYMASTEYQRQLADLQAAGLNPALALGGSSASMGGTSSGSIPSTQTGVKSGNSSGTGGENISSALALEATIKTAANHPKEFFNQIYRAAHKEAQNTAQSIKQYRTEA